MTSDIELKCWPEPFSAIWDGRKLFEIRRDDRPYDVGKILRLMEWTPEGQYTGREILAEITYLIRGPAWGGMVPERVVVSGIKILSTHERVR